MKNISKKIQFIVLAILLSNYCLAQKMDSYTFAYSPTLIQNGTKIYVKDFTNKGTDEQDFGAKYAKTLKASLNNDKHGLQAGVKLNNPWFTTKFYTVVNSEDEADYIIDGEYKFTKSNSSTYTEHVTYETYPGAVKLPVHFYKYTETSNASVSLNLFIAKKGETNHLKDFPFSKKESKSKTLALQKPAVSSPESFISTLSKLAINRYRYEFTPSFIVEKYKFDNIKPKNKELKKDYKAMNKSLEAFAKQYNVNEMGKIYLKMLTIEEDLEVHSNLGICYELIGNCTKAMEQYNLAGDKKGIERISFLIKVQETHKKAGIDVEEKDFI